VAGRVVHRFSAPTGVGSGTGRQGWGGIIVPLDGVGSPRELSGDPDRGVISRTGITLWRSAARSLRTTGVLAGDSMSTALVAAASPSEET